MVLAVLLIFSVAAPLNQNKVPPILPILMSAFNLSVSRAGLLMSVYALTGLILALPAGLIFQRLGYRLTGLIAGGSIALGAALGALSTSTEGMLASRVVEGAGTSFMAVLAPAIIAVWFAVRKRGVAMGIWATWVPLGATAMLLLAPALSQAAGWQAVWWFGCLYALVAMGLFFLVVKPAPTRSMPDGSQPLSQTALPPARASRVLRSRDVWLIGLTFACFNIATTPFSAFLPTYLNMQRGLSLTQAALLASLTAVIPIFSCPVGGMLSDRIGSRKRPYVVGMLLITFALPLVTVLGTSTLVMLIVAYGLVTGLVPTNIFTAGVEAAGDERLGGLAMGVLMVGQNAGMLIGPLAFGALVEAAGWPLAFASMAVIGLAGAVAGWLARGK